MRARGNFRYGLAGSWVGITQFSLSGVRGYSNEFKCVFLRDYCVSLRYLLHILCLQLGRCWVCGWGVGDFICLSLTAGVVTYTQHWDEGASHWVGVSMNTVPWCCTAQLAISNLVPWQFYHMFAHSRNNGPPNKCGLENLNICLLLLPFTSWRTLCVCPCGWS